MRHCPPVGVYFRFRRFTFHHAYTMKIPIDPCTWRHNVLFILFLYPVGHAGGQVERPQSDRTSAALRMVNFCAVVGCTHRLDRDKGISFYCLPACILIWGKKPANWAGNSANCGFLDYIYRADLGKGKHPYIHICSVHFITGEHTQLACFIPKSCMLTVSKLHPS